eukprot:2886442-Pleurochrysis_carterae.AAC.1
MTAAGDLAFQTLETLTAEVALVTAALYELPLSAFASAERPFRLVIQLDAARRRTRGFVAVVVKNPQLDSWSCHALHLLALG